MQFKSDLKKFSEKIDVRLELVVKKVAIEIHDDIVVRTPVDTGRARASWNIGLGDADLSVADENFGKKSTDGSAREANGQKALSAAKSKQSVIENVQPYQDVFITNNLPYIKRLEEGSSKQAPSGMVALALANAEYKIEKELAKILQ